MHYNVNVSAVIESSFLNFTKMGLTWFFH